MFNLFRRDSGYQDIGPDEVREALGDKRVQLVDVRSRGEYKEGHLPKAKLVPLPELGTQLHKIDPQRPVILYCRSGSRSARAARFLSEHGFQDVRNLRGGLNRWRGEIVR